MKEILTGIGILLICFGLVKLVLAMILRAVGYDENDEYTGDQWTLRVAATAREQGLLDNLNPDTNLAEPATRELVAQLIFEAIQIDTVHYVPAEETM